MGAPLILRRPPLPACSAQNAARRRERSRLRRKGIDEDYNIQEEHIMELKGSQTEKNLLAAFEGESKARNKYTYFAGKARQEDLPDVEKLFETMAKNESIHGKILYTLLYGEPGSSAENLKDAMGGEYSEWTRMYPDFAKTAREEGFAHVAEAFEKIAQIERNHEFQFLQALANLTRQQNPSAPAVEEEAQPVMVDGYKCQFCGAMFETRPDVCNVCGAIGSFEKATFQKYN